MNRGDTFVCLSLPDLLSECLSVAVESSYLFGTGDRVAEMVLTGGVSRSEGGGCGSDISLLLTRGWGGVILL